MSARRFNLSKSAIIQYIQKITASNKQKEQIKDTSAEISSEEQAEISAAETVLQTLMDSFSQVSSIENLVKREYKLLQEAKRLDVPVESYRRMFESYDLDGRHC